MNYLKYYKNFKKKRKIKHRFDKAAMLSFKKDDPEEESQNLHDNIIDRDDIIYKDNAKRTSRFMKYV